MSRCLNFQIQRIQSGIAISHIETLLHSLNAQANAKRLKLSVDYCRDEDYCNVYVETDEPTKVWERFLDLFAEDAGELEWMRNRWIVVTQGKSGWKDYLLLAHFDSSVELDQADGSTTSRGPIARSGPPHATT